MDREPAPPGADLEQVVVRAEVERRARALELRQLRGLEAGVVVLEDGARVDEARVQEGLEQGLAEVVMRRDVPGGAGARVARDEAAEPLRLGEQRVKARAQAVERRQAAARDPAQGDEVVAAPQALDVALTEPRAAAQRPAVGARVADLEPGAQLRGGWAEGEFAPAVAHLDPTAAGMCEQVERRSAGRVEAHRRPLSRSVAAQPQSSIDCGSSGSTLTTTSPPIFCL